MAWSSMFCMCWSVWKVGSWVIRGGGGGRRFGGLEKIGEQEQEGKGRCLCMGYPLWSGMASYSRGEGIGKVKCGDGGTELWVERSGNEE